MIEHHVGDLVRIIDHNGIEQRLFIKEILSDGLCVYTDCVYGSNGTFPPGMIVEVINIVNMNYLAAAEWLEAEARVCRFMAINRKVK